MAKKAQTTEANTAAALTTKQVAGMAKTTPRTLRRFLRSVKNDGVYTRYRFDNAQAERVVKAFQEWLESEDEAEPAPAQA